MLCPNMTVIKRDLLDCRIKSDNDEGKRQADNLSAIYKKSRCKIAFSLYNHFADGNGYASGGVYKLLTRNQ